MQRASDKEGKVVSMIDSDLRYWHLLCWQPLSSILFYELLKVAVRRENQEQETTMIKYQYGHIVVLTRVWYYLHETDLYAYWQC